MSKEKEIVYGGSLLDGGAHAPDSRTAKMLMDLAEEYAVRMPQFVLDLYCMFANKGAKLTSLNKLEKLANEAVVLTKKKNPKSKLKTWAVRSDMLKRYVLMRDFTGHRVFKMFETDPPFDATRNTLELMAESRKAMIRVTKELGTSAGTPVGDAVQDEGAREILDKEHVGYRQGKDATQYDIFDCGMYMIGLFDDPIVTNMFDNHILAKTNEVGAGDLPYYIEAHGVGASKDVLALAKEVSQSQNLLVFQLARLIEGAVSSSRKETHQVRSADDDYDATMMQDTMDIADALPTELGDPDLIDKKVATKEVQVIKYKEEDDKKQLLHVMVDASMSMADDGFRIGSCNRLPNANYIFTNAEIAKAVTLGMMMVAYKEDRIFFMRSFAGAPGDLHGAQDKSEIKKVMRYLNTLTFSGPSTKINKAMIQAIEDISTVPDLDKAEVLVITDAEGSIPDADVIKDLKKKHGVKINMLQVGKATEIAHHQDVCDRFLKMDLSKGLLETVEILK